MRSILSIGCRRQIARILKSRRSHHIISSSDEVVSRLVFVYSPNFGDDIAKAVHWSASPRFTTVRKYLRVDDRIDPIPVCDVRNSQNEILLWKIKHHSRVSGINIWLDNARTIDRSQIPLVKHLIDANVPENIASKVAKDIKRICVLIIISKYGCVY